MYTPQCLVLSLDFDGCTDRPSSQQAIIQHVSDVYTQYPSINRVVFLIGSLRQSLRLDISNALRNSEFPNYLSCTSLMDEMVPRLQTYLDAHHPGHQIEIIFDTFLQADIYGKLDAGTSFNAMKDVFSRTSPKILRGSEDDDEFRVMVRNKDGSEINLMEAPHLTDCGKITMIYGQLHHIAKHYSDSHFLMHFYDDRPDILRGLHGFYQTNTQFIPENITLKLFCQTSLPGHVPLSLGTHLPGVGTVNTEFHQHLRQLADMLQWRTISEYFPDLKDYLEEAMKPTELSTPDENVAETEYSQITIPEEFSNVQEAILSYQSTLEEAEEIFEANIQLDIEFFNEYLDQLDHFIEFEKLYEATYKKQSLLQQASLRKKDFMILNEAECALLEYADYSYEDQRLEAADYADKRCLLDERLSNHKKHFEAFKEHLAIRISSILAIPKEELLRKVEIFKNSKATTIHAPKAIKATAQHSFFSSPTLEGISLSEELKK